jgi:hypothetical protein
MRIVSLSNEYGYILFVKKAFFSIVRFHRAISATINILLPSGSLKVIIHRYIIFLRGYQRSG